MRAIMVSVDYADLLALTLPWNRHHFEEVWVVTSSADHATENVARHFGAQVVVTDLFYDRGASFNKWAALEHGLDVMGRRGWLCLMDADVLWPRLVSFQLNCDELIVWNGGKGKGVIPGQLCSPLRRMWNSFPVEDRYGDLRLKALIKYENGMPPENEWSKFPIHNNVAEWAGYSQIFHADDPALNRCAGCGYTKDLHVSGGERERLRSNACTWFRWHETDWKHAGGADSFFQAKWAPSNKVRPPFEVLHLGPAGLNWHGRATPRLDGTMPPDWEERQRKCVGIWARRRKLRAEGRDPFGPEKLGPRKAPE